MEKKRVNYIDTAKGIGIIAVVVGHMLPINWCHYIVHGFHVPLFFFLSALFLSTSLNFRDFTVKKFRSLMLPYYFAAVLSILVYCILGQLAAGILHVSQQDMDFSIWKNILGMFYANTETDLMKWNTPLWFLPCMFSTFLLVFLCEKYVIHRRNAVRVAICILSVGIGIFVTSLQPKIILPLQMQVSFHMAVWVEAGIFVQQSGRLKILQERIETQKSWRAAAVICLLLACILVQFNSVSVKVMCNSYGNYLLYLLNAMLFISSVLGISVQLQNFSPLRYLGRHSLAILLFHKFPILFIETLLPGTRPLIYSGHWASAMVVSAMTAFSIACCLILGKLLCMLRNRITAQRSRRGQEKGRIWNFSDLH